MKCISRCMVGSILAVPLFFSAVEEKGVSIDVKKMVQDTIAKHYLFDETIAEISNWLKDKNKQFTKQIDDPKTIESILTELEKKFGVAYSKNYIAAKLDTSHSLKWLSKNVARNPEAAEYDLLAAVTRRDPKVVKNLLNAGIKPNPTDQKISPLSRLWYIIKTDYSNTKKVSANDKVVFKILVDSGAKFNQTFDHTSSETQTIAKELGINLEKLKK